MNTAEQVERYVKDIHKVFLVRGEDALALARPGEYIATGKAMNAGIPHNGRTCEQGDTIILDDVQITRFAAWIKLGALVPVGYYRAYKSYVERQAFIEHELNPVARAYSAQLAEVDRSEKLLVAAQAQLEAAQERLKVARAGLVSAEQKVQDVLDTAPKSSSS